ncbi:MAG: hypothetical protein H3C35_07520 [Bacteroidetes bacterium]|nr:hypothetical protein [Bacteroidota bacterium]
MNICQLPDWVVALISAFFGGILGFLSNFALEYFKRKNFEKSIREAILGEIKANLESARKGDLSSFLWIDDVYKSNLVHLGYFDSQVVSRIVLFYAKVAQYKDRITRGYRKHLSEEKMLKAKKIKGAPSTFWGTVEILAKEIISTGDEIIKSK